MNNSSNQIPHILIIGDPILDTYIIGSVTRISPEAPIPVLLASDSYDKAGGAANVALNISAFTDNCTFVFPTSDHSESRTLLSLLKDSSINLKPLHISGYLTPRKTRFLSNHHHILRYDQESSFALDSNLLELFCIEFLKDADIVILSDYKKGFLHDPSSFIQLCHDHQIPCLVDPKSNDLTIYKYAYMLTPNKKEFSEAVGGFKDEIEFIAKAKITVETLQLQYLIVTLADEGAFVMNSEYEYAYHRSSRVDVSDVTGAGDTFLSVLAYYFAIKNDIHLAIEMANAAAGLSVTRLGTSVITPEDLRCIKYTSFQASPKQLTLNSFLSILPPSLLRPKIVFTNGCFDVLHLGHINYLKQAKLLADILVVGLNSDQSVRLLKGPNRPINIYADRSEFLAALDFVDFILPFDTLTPIELIKAISPDFLVKGGDYLPSLIVGYEHVTSYGGTVLSLDYHPGFSSTNLINQLTHDA